MRRTAEVKYDTDAKASYRKEVWRLLTQGRLPGPTMILTGPEGLEIPVLRSLGFEDSDMHLVDRVAAYPLMARDKHGALEAHNYYGDLFKAAGTMQERGVVLRYTNLDLCGTAARDGLTAVMTMAKHASVFSGARVAITWLKARDGHWYEDIMHDLAGTDSRSGLVDALIKANWPESCFLGEGEYNNGIEGKGAPMQWAAWELKDGI